MHYHRSPAAAIVSLHKHRTLLWQFTRRQVAQRYQGSMLGVVWALMTPLLMLGVYSFVFIVMFEARWGNAEAGVVQPKGEFALMIFSGLILHAFLAEAITRAPNCIIENRNFVKKVIFPLELLPVSLVLSALVQLLISMVVLIAAVAVVYHQVPWTVFYLPLLLLPYTILSVGLCWLLASLGVYLRDIGQVMGIVVAVLLFMSTIFYPADRMPAPIDKLIYLNPVSFIADAVRLVVIHNQAPDWHMLGVYYVVSLLVAVVGFAWFQRTRHGFADVV